MMVCFWLHGCLASMIKNVFLSLVHVSTWMFRSSRCFGGVGVIQVEVKVIPHCPFWVFPIVNAVSKKSSLSHPFGGFPHVNARFTE